VEGEEGRCDETDSGGGVVPVEMFAEVEEGEDGEDAERDDLLDHLELDRREAGGADAVGGDLQQVLEKSNAPADKDDLPQCVLTVFQVAVPGKGHEDVGEDEQNDSPHIAVGCGRGGLGFSGSTMTALAENLEKLEEAIERACRAAARGRGEVELMAVSKTYPAATLAEAAGLGLSLFGESRVQEFGAKAAELDGLRRPGDPAGPIRVHLIGHLQTNKAARAAELFDAMDSVDSVRLAEKLNEAAGKLGKRLPVLIEVKLSPEETKVGLEPESAEAAELLERLPGLEHLETRGLMTIAPWGGAEDVTRACFRSLREWRDRWAGAHPRLGFDVLSMGMSGDFALAIDEGATRIRVGTALFGKRQPWTGPE
jgi:pyridoxal phosphate enzyme (YggS family)